MFIYIKGMRMKRLLFLVLVMLPTLVMSKERIISIGPDITEIIYQLGAGDELVGRDMRSIYPPQAANLADVGYMRTLNAEGLLSLYPDKIIASQLAAPSVVFEQIESMGVPVIFISGEPSINGMINRILQVAKAVEREAQGGELVKQMQATLAQIPSTKLPLNVMFIRSFNNNSILAAGKETLIDYVFQIAGVNNALADMNRYQTLSGEGLILAKPDLIVTTKTAMRHFQNEEDFWLLDNVINTPAGKNRQLLVMDDMALLSFGLQTPQAILFLRHYAKKLVASQGNSN